MSHYLQRRGSYWAVVARGSNRVQSRHRSRSQAEQALTKLMPKPSAAGRFLGRGKR